MFLFHLLRRCWQLFAGKQWRTEGRSRCRLAGQSAQSSLEIVLITAAVLAMIVIIFSSYSSIMESTAALVIVKNSVVERQAFTDVPFHVEKIYFISPSDLEIDVFVESPELAAQSEAWRQGLFDGSWCTKTQDLVYSKTKYITVHITVAGTALC